MRGIKENEMKGMHTALQSWSICSPYSLSRFMLSVVPFEGYDNIESSFSVIIIISNDIVRTLYC